ncbi:MAG TPA: hypothetical protein VKY74_08370 [Chloroflexia bacterium]|nr:hypothetical protein [Chloroflexia bacterium]
MGIPTHEDARALLDLVRMRQAAPHQEAETWFMRDFRPGAWEDLSRHYPPGSTERAHLEAVLGYWELVGALVDNGLLNEDLLFDVLPSLEPIWERVAPWLPAARAELGSDLWENLEILVTQQRHWKQLHRPKATRL